MTGLIQINFATEFMVYQHSSNLMQDNEETILMMTNGDEFDRKSLYEIRVLGTLDHHWSDWFDGFSIQLMGDETLLVGEVADQAALLGTLTKIVNLSLTLLTVERKIKGHP